MKKYSQLFLVLILSFFSASQGLQCLDSSGAPIDWWIILKVPIQVDKKGIKYGYISEQQISLTFFDNINDPTSPLFKTLAQIENVSTNNNYASVFWNDQPQTGNKALTYAHAKGLIGAGETDGFVIVHSSPNFTNIQNSKIQLKISDNNAKYGQHFFCISLNAQTIDAYAYQLLVDYPYIYPESFVPVSLQAILPNLKKVIDRDYRNRVQVSFQVYQFQSLAGHVFYKFAKSRDYNVSFYDTVVSPYLKISFVSETWGNGQGGLLEPNCTGNYKAISNLVVFLDNGISYEQTVDHSKYGASVQGGYFTCLGDINRMQSQNDRGGGTVCLENSQLNSLFQKILSTRQTCGIYTSLKRRK